MVESPMSQIAEVVTVNRAPTYSTLQNVGALFLALLIDFFDVIPGEFLFLLCLEPVFIGYDAGITAIEAAFLAHMQVPVVKVLAMSGIDLIPLIDIIPWCTLAVLDKRFGIKIPLVTRMFNY